MHVRRRLVIRVLHGQHLMLGPKHLMGKGTSHPLYLYTVFDVWLWLHTCLPVTFIVACTTCGDMVMQTMFARANGGARCWNA